MKIDEYKFGEMVIEGISYFSDLIIFPKSVKNDWWREEGHLVQPNDLAAINLRKIDLLIVGKGLPGLMKVANSTKRILRENKVELIEASSRKAVEIYNSIDDKEQVVAVFHLTC